MTTAGEIINGSLRLIGQLAEGEDPTAAMATDALAALNMMLDSWSTESLSVYTTLNQTFTWPANQASRTFGPSGDFVGPRPIMLDDTTYFKDPATNISFGVDFVSVADYNSLSLKSTTSTYPNIMLVDTDFPDLRLTLYPVPTQDLTFIMVARLPLAQAVDLTTDLAFPPGYLRALRFCLARELAAEFGVEPSRTVNQIAIAAKRDIQRINTPNELMSLPSFGGSAPFNIYTG
jgi:hypothetical protein